LLLSCFLAVLAGAVLAFGGAEPASGFAAESMLFSLAACSFWLVSLKMPRAPWLSIILLSSYLAVNWFVTRPAPYPATRELMLVGAAVCSFCLAARFAIVPAMCRLLCGSLLILVLLEALYGLVQYLTGWQQIATFKKVQYTMMATGTYINPNHFAGLLEMALPLTFAWALWQFERLAASKSSGRRTATHQSLLASALSGEIAPVCAFFLFATLILAAAILFSRSRMGIFSAFIGVSAVAGFWLAGRRKVQVAVGRHSAVVLLLLMLACVLAAGVWIGMDPVLARFREAGSDFPSRTATWKATIELIREHPLWGSGPGSFEDSFTLVQQKYLTSRFDHAHNDYLELAEEWGLPGAILLFLPAVLIMVRSASAIRRAGLSEEPMLLAGCFGGSLAMLVHSVADFNLHIPANAFLFATLLGLAWALSERLSSREGAQLNLPRERASPSQPTPCRSSCRRNCDSRAAQFARLKCGSPGQSGSALELVSTPLFPARRR